jgi:hypothetical protein
MYSCLAYEKLYVPYMLGASGHSLAYKFQDQLAYLKQHRLQCQKVLG